MLLSMGTLIPIEPAGNGIPGGSADAGSKSVCMRCPGFVLLSSVMVLVPDKFSTTEFTEHTE
jgi:hypothetical protein